MKRRLDRIAYPGDLSEFSEIVDVRSPGEFREDHITGAVNLPVLTDQERHEVGLLYRDRPFEARKRGAAKVSVNIGRHVAAHFADKPRDYRPLVYCWRGGQRSQSLATVLAEIGWHVSVLDGGYKSYRRAVIAGIESQSRALAFHVINGLTGAGKTLLLRTLERSGARVLDLERLANHRGSLFGGDSASGQPSQKRFESRLFDTLRFFHPGKPVFVEAESPKIGYLNLPDPLWKRLKESPVTELNCPLEERTRYLVAEYRDWQRHPERILETLQRLRPFHSGAQIAEWERLVKEGDWPALTRSLLQNHYDRCYGTGGSGHYRVPERQVMLPAHDEASLTRAAEELLLPSKAF